MINKDNMNLEAMLRDCPQSLTPVIDNSEFYTVNDENEIIAYHWHDPHPDVTYRCNNYGLLGKDLVDDAEILAMGCSVTAGIGIAEKFTWPRILERTWNEPINVVAYPGGSVEKLFQSFLHYINIFKTPKKLLLMVPDFERMWYPNVLAKHVKLDDAQYAWCHVFWGTGGWVVGPDGFNARVPRTKNNILIDADSLGKKYLTNPETVMNRNALSLYNFRQACLALNVELQVCSWHGLTDNALMKSGIPEWVTSTRDIPNEERERNYYVFHDAGCHRNSKDLLSRSYWHRGVDFPNPHPGAHMHYHLAERFAGFPIKAKG